MSRVSLLEAVWGAASEGGARKLRVHISGLRKKIRESHPWRIRTVTTLANDGLGPKPKKGELRLSLSDRWEAVVESGR